MQTRLNDFTPVKRELLLQLISFLLAHRDSFHPSA
jgi:hypothetical protein